MDKNIIKTLQEKAASYEKEYEAFHNKTDPGEVFALECKYYLEPISIIVVPALAKRLKENTNETLESYLPYVFDRYHNFLIKEIQNFNNSEDSFTKKIIKNILQDYSQKVMKLQRATVEEQNDFIFKFYEENYENIVNICSRSPKSALDLLIALRTPKLQQLLIRKEKICNPIIEYINNNWIKTDWGSWLPNYFCYPRTKTIDEYMNKLIAKERLHIKFSKNLFPNHYEQIKIWLKNYEKQQEKANGKILASVKKEEA